MEAGTLVIFCNDANYMSVLASSAAMIHLSWAFVVTRGCPSRTRLLGDFLNLRRIRKLDIVRLGTCKLRLIFPSVIDVLRPSILPLSHWLNSFRGSNMACCQDGAVRCIRFQIGPRFKYVGDTVSGDVHRQKCSTSSPFCF